MLDPRLAVELWQAGQSVEAICRTLCCSPSWFYKWLHRWRSHRDDWFEPQSRCPHQVTRRLPDQVTEVVKLTRLSLYNQGLFCGAQAIRWQLEDLRFQPLPSLRTINRILSREDLTHQRTGRYQSKERRYPVLPAPIPNAVHQSDFVGPCYLQGPVRFYSYNSVDLATGRCAIEPLAHRGGQAVIDAIWAVWWRLGIPAHQQVDNDLIFYGSPKHPRGMGALIRLCLVQGVEPWFIPPKEPWRNGVVEKFNELYRHRFLARFRLDNRIELQAESRSFEQRHNQTWRYSKLQGQTPLQALTQAQTPLRWPTTKTVPRLPLPKPKQGRYHLVRFVRSDRRLDVFGEKFELPVEAMYEYVVATVDVARQKLEVYVGAELIDRIDYQLFKQ